MYTINEAHSIELFQSLRKDLGKLSLGSYFAQAAEVISQEDIPSPELLSLVLNCLHGLSRLNLPEPQVKAVFELRSACLAGYYPDLTGCHRCGNPFPDRIDISQGHLNVPVVEVQIPVEFDCHWCPVCWMPSDIFVAVMISDCSLFKLVRKQWKSFLI